MDKIQIKVQNEAQNMIVGGKQHSLFNSVTSNNPSLLQEQPLQIHAQNEMSFGGGQKLQSEIYIEIDSEEPQLNQVTGMPTVEEPQLKQIAYSQMPAPEFPINTQSTKLNSHLYGPHLTPCCKQFYNC